MEFSNHARHYFQKTYQVLDAFDWSSVETFSKCLMQAWEGNHQVFICGNGGSAANADHAANDLLYGLNPDGVGLNAHSLCSNFSVNSCAANDKGYELIFAHQIKVMGKPGDVLIVFSGSGNSENVLMAIEAAKSLGVITTGILGFTGGKAKRLLDIPIHFPVDDMQISEDLQMLVIHMVVQFLRKK